MSDGGPVMAMRECEGGKLEAHIVQTSREAEGGKACDLGRKGNFEMSMIPNFGPSS